MSNANLWIGIALLAVMLACCGPMLFHRRGRNGKNDKKAMANRRSSRVQ